MSQPYCDDSTTAKSICQTLTWDFVPIATMLAKDTYITSLFVMATKPVKTIELATSIMALGSIPLHPIKKVATGLLACTS